MTSTLAETNRSISIRLVDIPGYTELTALYDQYKIGLCEVAFMPSATTSNTSTIMNYGVASVIDHDDANTLSIFNDYAQYQSCAVHASLKPFKRVFTPRLAVAAYSGAFTSYANVGDMWIDAASASVEHYGVKVWIGTTNTAIHYQVWAKVHVDLRETH